MNEMAAQTNYKTKVEKTAMHQEKVDLLPEYRLPTETEWEYAALALEEISEENL